MEVAAAISILTDRSGARDVTARRSGVHGYAGGRPLIPAIRSGRRPVYSPSALSSSVVIYFTARRRPFTRGTLWYSGRCVEGDNLVPNVTLKDQESDGYLG